MFDNKKLGIKKPAHLSWFFLVFKSIA